VAYCAWLTGKLRAEGTFDAKHEARLPTVEEWQQAAGPQRYPWGKTFAAANANTNESGLEQTTPVHMYPDGKTTETEIWDLAGNAWEWTKDLDKSLSVEAYVLIGGSWYNGAGGVGSAARDWYVPGNGLDDDGFRVVVGPISRG
jgi:formylglycine-generating enzyme required for sulfatase activity